MKRLSSSDSSSALISICPQTDEQSPSNNNLYGREFQSMLEGFEEEEECVEEMGYHHFKKRRLGVEQVKALEKNFEVENKLEPERKVKLAQELGLQPRQVAVWFQNRRARWKTKQLERDYGVLKANFEALKVNFDALHQDNEALHKQIEELKSRLEEENSGSGVSVKEEEITMELGHKSDRTSHKTCNIPGTDLNNHDGYNIGNSDGAKEASLFSLDAKDGSSDSDTSAILNEDNHQHLLFSTEEDSSNSPNSSLICCFQFQKLQYVKMEEHNFLSADEACNFFNDEQAPNLQWYSQEQWN